jgi:catecholate siderophore receptor
MQKKTFKTLLQPRRRVRRRGSARLFVLSTLVAAATAGGGVAPVLAQTPSATASYPAAQMATYNIGPGPLSEVIDAFQRASGVQVSLALDSIGAIQSPGVSGRLSAERALQQILSGTGLTATFSAATQARIDLRTQTESVEVTAGLPAVQSPKYTVPLRDVAQTIAMVPRETFEQQGATTLTDVLRNVPGITLQAGEGGGASSTAGDMFNMRGFNASNSLFVDGVRDDGLISRDVFNLEQVEVFMGPTGSDVGRGTASGYVNMQSKVPHLGSDAGALLTYGSGGEKRLTTDLNWSAAGDAPTASWARNAAVRLNVLWQGGGVAGREEVERESKAFAPSVSLGLGTPTRVTVGAQILRQDNVPDYGVPGAAWEEAPLTPTTQIAPGVDQSNFYGTPAYDYDRAEQDSVTAKVEHDVSSRLTLRNQTRYNRTHREAVISAVQSVASYNPTTNQVTVARQGNERENEIWSNQATLTSRFSTGSLRHAANAGIDVSSEEQFTPTLGGFGTRPTTDIYNPDPNVPVTGMAVAPTGALSRGDTKTIAGYVFDSVELSQRWLVSGGVRWEHYTTDFASVTAAGVSSPVSGNGTLWSGKAGVMFRVREEVNLYASYGSTLTPPGTANFALSSQPNNQNNPNVEPQKSVNYEVGTKVDLGGGRLSLTGSVFRTENENVIFTVDATAIPPVFNQDDSQLVKGVSMGAMGRITNNWDVLANFGYLDSEVRTQNAVNNGRPLTLTPSYSGSIWTTYRFPVPLTLGGGLRFTDEASVNAAGTIVLPASQVIDALAEYGFSRHLSLRVNVYNLADEVYIRSVNNNGGRYNPGYPRSATVTANIRY